MNQDKNGHTGNVAQVVMHAMAACALFSCVFICVGGFAVDGGAAGQVFLVALLCGIALCSFSLSRPSLAEKLTNIERAHPVACGVIFGVALLASFVGLQVSFGWLVGIVLALLQGALFWIGLSSCVFLADVLELAHSMRAISVAATMAVMVSFVAVALGKR